MQPRDADDYYSDCAMEQPQKEQQPEEREEPASCISLSSSSPVMSAAVVSDRNASTPTANQRTTSSSPVQQLVGARKRKAIRVIKHQQQQVRTPTFSPSHSNRRRNKVESFVSRLLSVWNKRGRNDLMQSIVEPKKKKNNRRVR